MSDDNDVDLEPAMAAMAPLGRARPEHDLHKKWIEGGKKPEDLSPLLAHFRPLIQRQAKMMGGGAKMVNPVALETELTKHTVKAFESWNPEKSALATHVQWAMKPGHRFVAKNQNVARIPEEDVGKIGLISRTEAELSETLGRTPTLGEIAESTGLAKRQVARVKSRQKADISSGSFEVDVVGTNAGRTQEILPLLHEELNDKEKKVFNAIYSNGGMGTAQRTSALARQLGMTESEISRIKTSIGEKWKKYDGRLPSLLAQLQAGHGGRRPLLAAAPPADTPLGGSPAPGRPGDPLPALGHGGRRHLARPLPAPHPWPGLSSERSGFVFPMQPHRRSYLRPMTEFLTYHSTQISIDFGARIISLTDCWKAAGSPPSLRPNEWMGQVGPTAFRRYLENNLEAVDACFDPSTPRGPVYFTKKGGNKTQGTWGHWQLALAYAQDLSPAFRVWAQEQLRHVFLGPKEAPLSKVKPQLTPHAVEAAAQLERHLKRLSDRGYLPCGDATDHLSSALEKIWGIALPRVRGTTPRRPLVDPSRQPLPPMPPEAKPLVDETYPPAPVEPAVEPAAPPPTESRPPAMALGEGETFFKAKELPPDTFTGNGAAFYIDKIDEGIFTNYLHQTRGSHPSDIVYPRDSYGKEFNNLARLLGIHPLSSQKYIPGIPEGQNRYAKVVEAPALHSGPEGTAGVGARRSAVFTREGVLCILNHIRKNMLKEPYEALPALPDESSAEQ